MRYGYRDAEELPIESDWMRKTSQGVVADATDSDLPRTECEDSVAELIRNMRRNVGNRSGEMDVLSFSPPFIA